MLGGGYSRSGTRWLSPNRYTTPCHRCGLSVPVGTGEFRFDGTQWIVRHFGGTCHTPAYTHYISEESPAWRRVRMARLEYAGHRCEWRGLFSGRCRVSVPLQCHHRHYRTLGAESLEDVIILCLVHHKIADARRRSWGTWPLIGRPFWKSAGPIAGRPTGPADAPAEATPAGPATQPEPPK